MRCDYIMRARAVGVCDAMNAGEECVEEDDLVLYAPECGTHAVCVEYELRA